MPLRGQLQDYLAIRRNARLAAVHALFWFAALHHPESLQA